jgi:hypothetical protein
MTRPLWRSGCVQIVFAGKYPNMKRITTRIRAQVRTAPMRFVRLRDRRPLIKEI